MIENPIVIIEDNSEDCGFLTEALHIVGVQNSLKCFENAMDALKYLKSTSDIPFLIISDVNMPVMSGIALKQEINADIKLNQLKIPFIFLSTLPPAHYIRNIEKLAVQGHFQKPAKFDDLVHIVHSIIDSWKRVDALTG